MENKDNNGKLRINRRILKMLAGTFVLATLSGCMPVELAPVEDYNVIDPSQVGDNELLSSGLTDRLVVPGEEFKLIVNYTCDSSAKRAWRVTSDKFLYLTIYTEGLPAGTEVYIDNIHIDTSIKSRYACMDGILQDTMDDRIHNAQMVGFPISDNVYYYDVNAIEGCNQDFIRGTFYGYNGYSSSTIEERRYTEEDYRELGVYANKVQIVYDLLIKGPNDQDFRNVSVCTDFLVEIYQEEIEYQKGK